MKTTTEYRHVSFGMGFSVPDTPEIRAYIHNWNCMAARVHWKAQYRMERAMNRVFAEQLAPRGRRADEDDD